MFTFIRLFIVAVFAAGDGECRAAVASVHNTYGGQDSQLEKCRDRIRSGHRGFVLFASLLPLQGAVSKCKCIQAV